MRVRYDSEADILYILVKEGRIKDTTEVSDDLFVEYDENNHIVGIELWQARKNLLPELMSYVEHVTRAPIDLKL
ncbi:MAG: DUF2283 domain-containing protein [Halobacteriota archaeon]